MADDAGQSSSSPSSSSLDCLAPEVVSRALSRYASLEDLALCRAVGRAFEAAAVAALKLRRRCAGLPAAASEGDWRVAHLPPTAALFAAEARRRSRDALDSGDEHEDESPADSLEHSAITKGILRWRVGRLTRRRVAAVRCLFAPGGVTQVELFENDFHSAHALEDLVDLLRSPLCANLTTFAMLNTEGLDPETAPEFLDALGPRLESAFLVARPAPIGGAAAAEDALGAAVERLAERNERLEDLEISGAGWLAQYNKPPLETPWIARSDATGDPNAPPRLARALDGIRRRSAERRAYADALAPLVANFRDANGDALFANLAAQLEREGLAPRGP
jgi:hypothetical protein